MSNRVRETEKIKEVTMYISLSSLRTTTHFIFPKSKPFCLITCSSVLPKGACCCQKSCFSCCPSLSGTIFLQKKLCSIIILDDLCLCTSVYWLIINVMSHAKNPVTMKLKWEFQDPTAKLIFNLMFLKPIQSLWITQIIWEEKRKG